MKTHTPVYRPILSQALHTAWHHRELWPIAAIAVLAGTGAALNDVLKQAKFALSLPQGLVFPDLPFSASPLQIVALSIVILGLTFLALLAIAACQQILLQVAHRAAARKTPLTASELKKHINYPRLLRFLGLDLFSRLLIINLLTSVSVLLSGLDLRLITDVSFDIIFALSTLMFALFLNVVVMLALIGVAKKDLSVAEALISAWTLFKRHPVVCLEMACLLFAANFILTATFNGALLLIGVPTFVGFALALEASSIFLTSLFMLIATLATVTLMLIFAGFTTTFTYAAWSALAEYLIKHRTVSPRVIVHSQRFLAHVRS